jgi:septal ring factor EnvC (AmiA/AmiB activator)
MGTNGTDIAAHLMLEEQQFGIERIDQNQDHAEADYFPLRPLVDKIAFDIAKGLVAAVKELEHHIAGESRKVGEAVERRLDLLQMGFEEVSRFAGEQQSTNSAVQEQLQQLTATDAGLREESARHAGELETLRTEARDFSAIVSARLDSTSAAQQESNAGHAADLAALRDETRTSFQSVGERIDNLCRDLGIQQEDIAIAKTTLCTISSRVDAFVERLDRQAEAVRSLYTSNSQRDTELEQIVDGLARLRAHPTPVLTNEL